MYNKSYAVSIQSDQTETPDKEKSVMSCIFKRYHVKRFAENTKYIFLYPSLMEMKIHLNGGRIMSNNFQALLKWRVIFYQYQPQAYLLSKFFHQKKI